MNKQNTKVKFFYTNGKTYTASRVTQEPYVHEETGELDYMVAVPKRDVETHVLYTVKLHDLAAVQVKRGIHTETLRLKPNHPVCVALNK